MIKLERIADAKSVLDQALSSGLQGEGFDKLKEKLEAHSPKVESKVTKYQDPNQNQIQPLLSAYTEGRTEWVLSEARKLLITFPNSVALYNIIGAAHQALSRLEEAIEAYEKAISIKPDFAEANYNMGNALQESGNMRKAIEAYKKAISIKPDYLEALNNLNFILRNIEFRESDPELERIIITILDRKTLVRPSYIANSAISLLKHDPRIKDLFQKDFRDEVNNSFEEIISNLAASPLLLKIMGVCPLADLEFERLLSYIRSALLLNISKISKTQSLLKFQSALALQCFTNEYIYDLSPKDVEELKKIELSVEEILSKKEQPEPHVIMCLASYKALHEYTWHNKLSINSNIKDVFTRQISEPQEEKKIELKIKSLAKITDPVSSEVRKQYEENPYPRWVNTERRLDATPILQVAKELKLKLPNPAVINTSAPRILIAGCGTGQHSISTASRFRDCNVLAIDLSLSSLAYAYRKTKELGIDNIEYMHADILQLSKLNRQFDIIESSGVLHHMNDPMAGWLALMNCLKQGGLMKIGLYSELARQHIVKIREEISKLKSEFDKQSITALRSSLIESKKPHHKKVSLSLDFHNFSGFRDLILHVQEHRFTIPQIRACLDELKLDFCGFEGDWILRAFEKSSREKISIYDLSKWQSFEEANPGIFGGMYQFWCQKVI